MRIRTASDLFYASIVRLPLLALLVAIVWILMSGMAGLEEVSYGAEWFVGNHETDNVLDPAGVQTNLELMTDAYNTDDPAKMQAALDQLEVQQQAIADNRLEIG